MHRHKIKPCEDVLPHTSDSVTEPKSTTSSSHVPAVSEHPLESKNSKCMQCWTKHSPTNYSMVLDLVSSPISYN